MKSIKSKLFIFTILHLVFLFSAVIAAYLNIQEMEIHSTNKIVAERQLSLTQILTLEVMNVVYNLDDQDEYVESIQSTSLIFENALKEMKTKMKKSNFSENVSTDATTDHLISVWEEYKKSLSLVFKYKEISRNDFFTAVDLISELEYDLYVGVHSIIKAYEEDYEHHVKNLNIIFYLFVIAEIILIVVRWIAVNALIFTPLEIISNVIKKRRAIEDYGTQIPPMRNDEIGMIVDAINESGTRLIQTTNQLSLSESTHRDLIDHAVDAMVSINQEGTITLFNKAACRIFEYSEEEALGMKVTELIPEDYRAWHEMGIKRYNETGEPHVIGHVNQFDGLSKSKERIPFSFSVWENTTGKHSFTALLRDAREGKKRRMELENAYKDIETAYKDLQNAQAQVIHSEKMASIGQLAAGVAHEINNPIGFINSNLSSLLEYVEDVTSIIEKQNLLERLIQNLAQEKNELRDTIEKKTNLFTLFQDAMDLKKELDLDFMLEDMQSSIKESMEGAERVRDIISSLKDYAHVDDEKMKSIDVNESIESTLKIAWNELKYKAEVKKLYGNLPPLICHPTQIKQVVMNLLINAAQSIEKMGEIKIETKQEQNNICIIISDTGQGIPKENIPKIFDPFFTTKDIGKGTGLGLNICYNIVGKHNGSITVESEVGKGTTFTLLFPLVEENDEKDSDIS